MAWFLIVLFSYSAVAAPVIADICVLPPLTVVAVRGRVVTPPWDRGGEESLEGATVRLHKRSARSGQKVVAESTTSADGTFSFVDIRPGTYALEAKHPYLYSTWVEIHVIDTPDDIRAPSDIVMALGAGPSGCNGGYAELRPATDFTARPN